MREISLNKNRIAIVLLTLSGILLAALASIIPVQAYCNGPVYDSWTPRTGVTITISASACPGTNPTNTAGCTKDPSIAIDNGTAVFAAFGNYQGYTGGGNYQQTFNIGCSNLSKTYGPFSGTNIPNCGYTDYTVNARDTVSGQTHQLLAEGTGQTRGICPV